MFSMRWKARLKRVQRANLRDFSLGGVTDYVQQRMARGAFPAARVAPLDYAQDPTVRAVLGTGGAGLRDDGEPDRFFH